MNYARVTALIPAYNEAESVGATVRALMEQDSPVQVIVVADNCKDRTAEIAHMYGAEVIETRGNRHKKPGALNTAFALIENECDFLVCVDADTVVPPHAIRSWVREMRERPMVAAIMGKVTVRLPERGRWTRFLTRLQRIDFAYWIDYTLKKKGQKTTCIGGQAAMFRISALTEIARRDDRPGPWTQQPHVMEDFEISYRLREAGWFTVMSTDVRTYTDAMPTLRALWAQRMKWTVGSLIVLRDAGTNRHTIKDWIWQAALAALAFNRLLLVVTPAALAFGFWTFHWYWFALMPVLILLAANHASRVPDHDRWDFVMALTILPWELWEWMRAGWFIASYFSILTRSNRDRWQLQSIAERG